MRFTMCKCRNCKRAARKGLWLGQKRTIMYVKRWYAPFVYERWEGMADSYVPCPHLAKGKRVRRQKNIKIDME